MPELEPNQAFDAALRALPASLLDRPIGIAVSGGGDSLALLLLARRSADLAGRNLIALTVDHGLRAEARAEADMVAGLCAHLGVAHEILTLEGAAPRQSDLRRRRHAALAGALRARGGHLLLTGHTADDQAETFLMRARQGSGWYGLAGMQALSASPAWPEGEGVVLARPLLAVRREALRAFLRREGQAWVEDPSNENPAFERVRMRQQISSDKSRAGRILALMADFQTLRMIEDALIGAWLARNVSFEHQGMRVAGLAKLPIERRSRVLGLLIQIAGDRQTPPRGESLVRLSKRLDSEDVFKGATLGGVRIMRRAGGLVLRRENAPLEAWSSAPQARRLRQSIALLTRKGAEIAASAGKESFLEDLVPIF